MKKKRIAALITALAVSAATLAVVSADTSESVAEDGLPILGGTFEDHYKTTTDAPLGIASNFHLFAFDSINIGVHCNGNFAAPNVVASSNSGTNQFNDKNTSDPYNDTDNKLSDILKAQDFREVNIATKSLETNVSTFVSDLLIPVDLLVTDANGEYTKTNPIEGQTVIGGQFVDMNGVYDKYIYHVKEDFIDFAGYQKEYIERSNQIAQNSEGSRREVDYQYTDENTRIGYVELNDRGTSVVNMTYADLALAQNAFEIRNVKYDPENWEYTNNQTVIINVDMADCEDDSFVFDAPIRICYKEDGTNLANAEQNVYAGSIVLWNFYDSSKEDGAYEGTLQFNERFSGCILAPKASVITNSNIDGNIIANNITTKAESHRCDFKGTLILNKVDPDEEGEEDSSSDASSDASSDDDSSDESGDVDSKDDSSDESGDVDSGNDSEDDTSSKDDSSSEDDTSSKDDSSSDSDTSSKDDSSSEDDTSSKDDSSSKNDSSSEDDSSSKNDSSSEDDTSSKDDSSSDSDTSSKDDSSSEDDTSSKDDSSSEDDSDESGNVGDNDESEDDEGGDSKDSDVDSSDVDSGDVGNNDESSSSSDGSSDSSSEDDGSVAGDDDGKSSDTDGDNESKSSGSSSSSSKSGSTTTSSPKTGVSTGMALTGLALAGLAVVATKKSK